MSRYNELLRHITDLLNNIDDEIILRGFDLTKLEESITKAESEA